MPIKVAKVKIEEIANNYISNGSNEIKALIDCGYDPKYAKNRHKDIFANVDLCGLIQEKKRKLELKTEETLQDIYNDHKRLQELAEAKGDLVNASRNLEDRGKMKGAYADRSIIEQQSQEQARPKSPAEQALQAEYEDKIMRLRIQEANVKLVKDQKVG